MSEDQKKEAISKSPQAQQRFASIQRSASETETCRRIKEAVKAKVEAVRQGHTTGGYCDTDSLMEGERQLHAIISAEIEEAQIIRDSGAIKRLERELAGLAYRPRLVVAND